MKKFTKILICIMLCVISVCLIACDSRSNKEKSFTYPAKADAIESNGGLAVHKGDYIYCANGFVSVENSEKGKSYNHAGLMLIKLDSNGKIVTDEEGLLHDDYFIYMSNQLSGFEATNLFISGDYLYFTTQSQENYGGENYKDNVWAKEIVVFNRIKLDKTGTVEKLYQSQSVCFSEDGSQLDFKYYELNDEVYILIHEKGDVNKLVSVVAGKTANVVEEATSVTLSNNLDKIFYIKNLTELYHYNAQTNESTKIDLDFENVTNLEIKFASEKFVYVAYTKDGGTELASVSTSAPYNKNVICYDISIFDNVYLQYDEIKEYLIVTKANTIRFLSGVPNAGYSLLSQSIVDNDATSINIVGFVNGCVVYLDNNNNLKTVSYLNCLANQTYSIDVLSESLSDINTEYFDISEDCAYMYFYSKVDSAEYLHRVRVLNYTTNQTPELIGDKQ